MIFVDDSADSVVSSGSERLEVGDLRRQGLGRGGTVQAHVRPVLVVMRLVLTQHAAQVWQLPDERAVEKLAAASPDPAP